MQHGDIAASYVSLPVGTNPNPEASPGPTIGPGPKDRFRHSPNRRRLWGGGRAEKTHHVLHMLIQRNPKISNGSEDCIP